MSSNELPIRQHREKYRGFFVVATAVTIGSRYRCNCVIFRPAANAASFNCDVIEAFDTPEPALRQGAEHARREIDRRLEVEPVKKPVITFAPHIDDDLR